MKYIVRFVLIFLFFTNGTESFSNEFKILSRFDYYTERDSGEILIYYDEENETQEPVCLLRYEGLKISTDKILEPGLNRIPFINKIFDHGINNVQCIIVNNKGDTVKIKKLAIPLLDPKENQIRIDRLTGGLISGDLPYFPFGFYCYFPVKESLPEEEVVKGFNMISSYQKIDEESFELRKKYMDRCAKLGIKVNYNLLSVAGGGGVSSGRLTGIDPVEKRDRLKKEILAFRDHPALLSWYISDEPVGQGIPPEPLIKTYKFIKNLDPYHPVSIVFAAPQRAKEYREAMDIIMTDPYPVPNRPIGEINYVAQLLMNEFRYEKPVWLVPQAFGGNEWWLREPTPQEIRNMTYLGLVNGVTGIQYFVRHGMNSFPKSTITWNECGAIAMEVAELTPWLINGEPGPSIRYNRNGIRYRTILHGNRLIVIVVNLENFPKKFEFSIDGNTEYNHASLIFENRKISGSRNLFTDMVDAFGTRVYLLEDNIPDTTNIPTKNLMPDPSFENHPTVGIPAHCYLHVGRDRGSTAFIDSRIALDRNHSLRFITPQYGKGLSASFFPQELKLNNRYIISVYARGNPLDTRIYRKEKKSFFEWLLSLFRKKQEKEFMFSLGLDNYGTHEFKITGDWKKYSLSVYVNNEENLRSGVDLELIGAGTAWFDMLTIIPEKNANSLNEESSRNFKKE